MKKHIGLQLQKIQVTSAVGISWNERSKKDAMDENVLFIMRNKEEYTRTLYVHNDDTENSEDSILRLLSSQE